MQEKNEKFFLTVNTITLSHCFCCIYSEKNHFKIDAKKSSIFSIGMFFSIILPVWSRMRFCGMNAIVYSEATALFQPLRSDT